MTTEVDFRTYKSPRVGGITGKRWKPNEQEVEIACSMYAFGIPQKSIASILRVDEDTLLTKLGDKMESYKEKANAKVASTLYQMAISGNQPAATFFWLKTRARWRETDRLEIESRNINVNVEAKTTDPRSVVESVRILIESGALKLEDILPAGFVLPDATPRPGPETN